MNSVTLSNEVIVVTFYNSLYDLNDIQRALKIAISRLDALSKVITEEISQLSEDTELVERIAGIKVKIEDKYRKSPRFVITQELHDSLLPFVDNIKLYLPDIYNEIVEKHAIPVSEIETRANIDISIIMLKEDNHPDKREFSPEELEIARKEIHRNLDLIDRELI